jgi:hypothetical protein
MWTSGSHGVARIPIVLALFVIGSSTVRPGEISKFAMSKEASLGNTAEEPDAGCDCSSVYDFEMTALEPRRTSIVRPPKEEKPKRPFWKPSRRRGLRRALTTFYSVHSDEAVPVLENRLPPAEVFDELFRCRGFGTQRHIDPRLIETAIAAARHFKSSRIEVISGYRSPKFNDALAKKGRHVATESRHTKGEALDIRIVSAKAEAVGRWLFDHFDGGVGTYRSNDFVHIDVGPKRRWQGR